jgi:hypothetical protein
MVQRPVTLTDIVAGHVSLEIEGFDRIYLNGYVPALQLGRAAGGVPRDRPPVTGRSRLLPDSGARKHPGRSESVSCHARFWLPVLCGAPRDALSASAPVFASGKPDRPDVRAHNPTCNG